MKSFYCLVSISPTHLPTLTFDDLFVLTTEDIRIEFVA